jgi:hypothetical protein
MNSSPRGPESSSNSARSARGDGNNGDTLVQNSARGSQTAREVMESSRNTMSTARVQTALAALAAEKQALESRLAMIDAALEDEGKKSVSKRTNTIGRPPKSTKIH